MDGDNEYGSVFIDFLLNSNYCVPNGRNYIENGYTCIRPQGCSAVDFCCISHVDLNLFQDFRVIKMSDIVNKHKVLPIAMPDHSMLTWTITCGTQSIMTDGLTVNMSESYIVNEKYKCNTKNVPHDFLYSNETVSLLHNTVCNLESSLQTQNNTYCISNSYQEL